MKGGGLLIAFDQAQEEALAPAAIGKYSFRLSRCQVTLVSQELKEIVGLDCRGIRNLEQVPASRSGAGPISFGDVELG